MDISEKEKEKERKRAENATRGAILVSKIGEMIDKNGLKRTDVYKIAPSGTLSAWKDGQEPKAYTICKLADFLGTTVDFLLTGKTPGALPQEELELLEDFRQLDKRDQADILGNIKMKLDAAKKGDILSSSGNA